jgi:hypothetical protein
VEDLLVVVMSTSLGHDLLGLHGHLILLVDLDFGLHLLPIKAFYRQLALCDAFSSSLVLFLESDFLLHSSNVESAV